MNITLDTINALIPNASDQELIESVQLEIMTATLATVTGLLEGDYSQALVSADIIDAIAAELQKRHPENKYKDASEFRTEIERLQGTRG